MSTKNKNEVDLALMARDVAEIKGEVLVINQRLESKYVTQVEFEPIKKIVYGMVSLILVGVIGALLGIVIIK